MKRKIKIILCGLENLFFTLISLLFAVLFSRKSALKKKVERQGPIIILGNGPSLRDDLDALIELVDNSCIDVCAVNDFAFSDAFFNVRPSVYVLADPNYWNENVEEEIGARRIHLIAILAHDVTWPMRVMIPIEAKGNSIFDCAISRFVTFEYYNRTPISGFDWVRFRLFDVGVGMPPPFNVLIAALTLSISDGYKKIYILGADHSWHEELNVDRGSVLVAQKHFYDKAVELKPVYKSGEDVFTIGELFVRWGKVFKVYEDLALYAKYKRVDVYNLSSKSYIDAFPRARLSEFDGL